MAKDKELDETLEIVKNIQQSLDSGLLTADELQSVLSQLPAGRAVSTQVRLDTSARDDGSRNHDYGGKHQGAVPRLSVTKIASLLTHEFDDYKKIVEDSRTRMRALEEAGKKNNQEYRTLQRQAEEAERGLKNLERSQVRGTGFHKLVEILEKTGKTGAEVTKKQIRDLAVQEEEIGAWLSDGEGGISATEVDMAQKLARKYEQFKKQAGLSGRSTTEKSLGMIINTGKQIVEIVGTFDAFYHQFSTLVDNKSSGSVDFSKIGVQLNLLKKLMQVNGLKAPQSMKVLHTPFNPRNSGGIYNVGEYTDAELMDYIDDAFDISSGKRTSPRKRVRPVMQSQLTPYTYTDKKSGEERQGWQINGYSLYELEQQVREGYMSIETVVDMFSTLSEEAKNHFANLAWSTKRYGEGLPKEGVESDTLYRKGDVWKAIREAIPSAYRTALAGVRAYQQGGSVDASVGSRPFVAEDGSVHSVATIGGAGATEWSKIYRTADPEMQEWIIDYLHESMEKALLNGDTEAVSRVLGRIGRLDDKGKHVVRDEDSGKWHTEYIDTEHTQFYEDFYKRLYDERGVARYHRLGELDRSVGEELGINDRSKEENEAAERQRLAANGDKVAKMFAELNEQLREIAKMGIPQTFEEAQNFIRSLRTISQQVHEMQSFEGMSGEVEFNSYGDPLSAVDNLGVTDNWLYILSDLIKKIENGPFSKKEKESLTQEVGYLGADKDGGLLGTQTGYRLSWLHEAKGLYDSVLADELKEINETLSEDDKMTPEEYAKMRLTPEQYGQYQDSSRFRSMFTGDATFIDILKQLQGADPAIWQSDLAHNLQKAVGDLLESFPTLLDSKTADIFFRASTAYGGGGSTLRRWDKVRAEDKIRAGDIVRRYEDAPGKIRDDVQMPEVSAVESLTAQLQKVDQTVSDLDATEQGLIDYNRQALSEDVQKARQGFMDTYKTKVNPDDNATDIDKAIETYDQLYPEVKEVFELQEKHKALVRAIREKGKGNTTPEELREVLALEEEIREKREMLAGTPGRKARFELLRQEADYAHANSQVADNGAPLRQGESGKLYTRLQAIVDYLQKNPVEYNPAIDGVEDAPEDIEGVVDKEEDVIDKASDVIDKVEEVVDKEPVKEADSAPSLEEKPEKPVVSKKSRRKKKSADSSAVSPSEGGLLDVHATSETDFNKAGKKVASYLVNDVGKIIGIQFVEQVKKTFADYGPDGLVGYIQQKRAGKNNKETRQATRDELTGILSKVSGYHTNAGTLNVNGEKQLQKIMEAIYGDKAKADTRVTTPRVIVEGSPIKLELKGNPIEAHNDMNVTVSGNVIINGGEIREGGSDEGGHGFRRRSTGGSPKEPGETEEQSEIRLAKYLELLKQIQQVELDIFKIEKQLESARARSDDAEVAGLEGRKGDLETLKQQLEDDKHAIDQGDFTTVFSKKQQLRIQDTLDRYSVSGPAAQAKYESSHTLEDQISNERELQKLLNQRLGLEEKISSEQKTINTSFSGQEKNALARLISMQEEEVGLLDEKIQKLVTSGNLRKEELQEIVRQYQIQQQTRQAQAAAKDHGSMSLFDRMKFDVQRSITRVMDYGVSMRLLNSIPRGLNKIYQLTVQLGSALTSLRIVTGMNREEAEATMITYQKFGKELGATTQEVAQSAAAWLRQGYSVEEAGNLIDASMKLSKLGFMQADQATQVLTASLKGFKLEVSNAMDVVDKLTQMDQKAAVSAQGVSEALSLMANSARLAGLSINQAIAMVSTVGEVTQQSMSTVGNSMKTMLARFGNVKAGAFTSMSEDGEDAAESINDTEKVLRTLGISIRTASGEMRDFDDVLADVAEKWNTLDTVSKNAVAGALGGVRQREGVVTLLENYDRYIELTKEAEESEGTANKKYEAYMDSLEAHLKELQNAWEKFVQQLEASPIIKGGIDFLTGIINNMDTLISLVSTLGGAFLAVKLPGWLMKFGKDNFGGGRLGNFFGNLIGGNNGFIGSRINDKRESSIRSKYNSLLGVGGDDELDSIMASYDYDPDMYKDDAGYKARKATLESKRDKEIAESRLVKDKNVFDNSTKGAVERGNTILDKILLLLKKQLKGEKFTDKDEATVEKEHAKQSAKKGMSPGAKRALGAAGAGLMAGVTSGASKTTVGDSSVDKLWNKTGQTVEADAADKAIKGVASGVLAGVGTYFLGPLGGMLGNLLGGALGDLFSFLRHREELERKQRVEEAKKQLEALGKVDESVLALKKSNNLDILTGEDLKETEKAFTEMISLLTSSVSNQKELLSTITNIEALNDKNILSFGELKNFYMNTDASTRNKILTSMEVALKKREQQEFVASQEEERYQASKQQGKLANGIEWEGSSGHWGDIKYSTTTQKRYGRGEWNEEKGKYSLIKGDSDFAINDSAFTGLQIKKLYEDGLFNATSDNGFYTFNGVRGGSAEEILTNALKAKEILSQASDSAYADWQSAVWTQMGNKESVRKVDPEFIKKLDEIIDSAQKLTDTFNQYEEQRRSSAVEISYLQSGVRDMTTGDVEEAGYGNILRKMIEDLEKEGYNVVDQFGNIDEKYLSSIDKQLKSDTQLWNTLQNVSYTFEELQEQEKEQQQIVQRTGKSVKELRKEAMKSDEEVQQLATSLNLTSEEFIKMVYEVPTDKIQQMSWALGMSTEKLESMSDALKNIKFSDVIKSISEINQKIDDSLSIFSQFSSTLSFSRENLVKYLSENGADLYNMNDNEGGSQRSVLSKMISSNYGENNTNKILLQGKVSSEIQQNTEFFAQFKKKVRDEMANLLPEGSDLAKRWEEAKTFDQAWEVLNSEIVKGSETIQEELQKAWNFELDYEAPTEYYDKLFEYFKKLNEEQINNLEKQKEALTSINEERKKELELMKAQEALENAKKEKKMVYREGVGFVYEADEEAIGDAKEKVDDLESQKQEEYLQMEIERLELENEIMEYIPTIQEWQGLEAIFDEWTKSQESLNENVNTNISALSDVYTKTQSILGSELLNNLLKAETEKKSAYINKIEENLASYQSAKADYDKAAEGTVAKYEAARRMNSAQNNLSSSYTEAANNLSETSTKQALNDRGISSEEIDAILKSSVANEALSQIEWNSGDKMASNKGSAGIVNQDYTVGDSIVQTDGEFSKQFKKDGKTWVIPYDSSSGTWASAKKSLSDYNEGKSESEKISASKNNFDTLPPWTIVGNSDYADKFFIITDQKAIHKLYKKGESAWATGTYDSGDSGYSKINELGTEGIVTPEGTFTALPSHTGIVPADITKNVWKLGEVAPTLIERLGSLKPNGLVPANGNTTNNDGMFIDQLNMTVYPTKDYDMEKFLSEAKAKARITRHNN